MAAWQFKHPREHYAQLYAVSPRTVSRWAQKGFPLDDESQTRLLLSAGVKSISHGGANAPRTASGATAGAHGMEASIRRLQAEEARAHADFESARANANATLADLLHKQWLRTSEQLRKVEQSTPEIEEANKNTVRIEEVGAALNDLFLKLRQDLESMPKRIALEAVGQDELGIREIIKREIETVISALYVCKYLGGGESE
jgi:hypothetical protein